SVFGGTGNLTGAFTANSSGNSGPIWAVIQPTGNSTGGRFLPGTLHNIRYGIIATGGAMPSAPSFVGTKTLTALDIGVTPLTVATTDDGAYIQGNAQVGGAGKFVCAYSNTLGTGDPIAVGLIRGHSYNQLSNNELPASIDSILKGGTNVVAGDYALLIPIGANNTSGIQRLELRNNLNVVSFPSTSLNGIWPSGANTTSVLRRGVVSILSTDAPLPVKLVNFSASLNNNQTELNWSTASETNNKGFEVERSTDGENFETIGFVKGNGNSNSINKYSFTDANQSSAFYRLKQIDFDGKFEYSNIVKVSNDEILVDLNPNPFNDNLVINSPTMIENAEIIDVTGKVKLMEIVNSNKATINTSALSNGIYFIRINNGQKVITKRIIKN
ncbi:MAG: T9SS type A sorting domain-containing protein, partial [Candidatus Methylacidiphilales bacterium]